MTQSKMDYDLAIVGGGLVGCSLACALAHSDLKIAVIETGPLPVKPGPEYDLRVSAITPASENFFRAINTWETVIRDFRIGEVREMKIWDSQGKGSLHINSAEIGEPYLATIVENRTLRFALFGYLQQFGKIDFFAESQFKPVAVEEGAIKFRINDSDILCTRLIVGSDGAKSRVRNWFQFPLAEKSYGQQAIVATVRTAQPHNNVALQRFLATGPLAFLPLDNSQTSSIVWSAETRKAMYLMQLADDEFARELSDACQTAFGEILEISERANYPLVAMRTDHPIQHRVVLVGDAAHRVHPLAGQGLNLGIADVATLSEIISQQVTDVGNRRGLRAYERARAADINLVGGLMTGLNYLFASSNPLVVGTRNFGIDLLDNSNVIKNMIMRLASGTRGDVPEVSRSRYF